MRPVVILMVVTALAGAAGGAPLVAQQDSLAWQFTDAQGGFCIWYLADPEVAPRLVPNGTRLRLASETTGLPVSITRIVQDEPRFGSWIPGVVCIGRFAAVSQDGLQIATMRDSRSQVVTITGLAAHSPQGQDAEWYLLELGLEDGGLRRRANDALWQPDRRELRFRRGLADEEEQWELSLDGARLTWQGYLGAEKRVGATRSMSFGYVGNRASRWKVVVTTSPATEQTPIGALMVAGKDPLALAMISSPIRAVTASEHGGTLVLTFIRSVTPRS